MHGSKEGGAGGPDPYPSEKNHNNIGFLSNTGPDPLKITKLSSKHSMLGHHRHAISMAICWPANDVQLIVLYRSSLPSSTTKKNLT